MLIHELLKKDPDIFPELPPLIIFYRKFAVWLVMVRIASAQGTLIEDYIL